MEKGKKSEDEKHLGHTIHADSRLHIGSRQLAVVLADIGFVEDLTEIIVRTAEPAVEDARKGCLGISAVGRSMAPAVAPDESEERETERDECIGQKHEKGRQASRDEVGHVIDASRPATKVLETLRPVTDHGVLGVHHLVGQHGRHTAHRQPEEGSHNAVAEVLGQGFESGRAHLLSRKLRRVAAHDSGHLPPTLLQRTVEGEKYGPNLTDERGSGQAIENQQDGNWIVEEWVRTGAVHQNPGCKEDEGIEQDGHHRTFQHPMAPLVQMSLAPGYHLAKAHDRMGQPRGVTKEKVEQPGGKEGEGHGGN